MHVDREKVKNEILDCLTEQPCTKSRLARICGHSEFLVYSVLLELLQEGKVERQVVERSRIVYRRRYEI